MILSELVDLVCTTINQTEATDIAACKMYFKLRHQMLWQLALWKDSLVSYTQTITSQGYDPTSSVWLPTRQILMVHPLITHVIAARTADRKLSVQSQDLFYCRDIDSFMNQGMALDYVLLSPAVWDMDTAQTLQMRSTDLADENAPSTVDFIESDGITEQSLDLALTAAGSDLGSVLTLENWTKITGAGQVNLGIFTVPAFSLTVHATHQAGAWILGIAVNSNNVADVAYSLFNGSSSAVTANVGDTLYLFINNNPAGSYAVTGGGQLDVDSAGNQTFTATADTFSTVMSLAAADTAAARRQRVQLVGSITDNTVLRILGKRTCPRLTNDNDQPAIQGSEICLIPAVHADMLKRERQYGKAITMATQEFGPMLDTLKKEQTVQQAFKKRLVPVDGFSGGNSYPFLDGSPLSF